MTLINIAPTKSSLLTLKHQLAVAQEGYELLEQKRQILVFELMARVKRAGEVNRQVDQSLASAYSALREATLDIGSRALDEAARSVRLDHRVQVESRQLMGLRLPGVTASTQTPDVQFGVGGTSTNTDLAFQRFTGSLPLLAELAELETAVLRLAAELRKTQRRCNALDKVFIPNTRQTIIFITASLEERERESFVITRMVRDRLGKSEP